MLSRTLRSLTALSRPAQVASTCRPAGSKPPARHWIATSAAAGDGAAAPSGSSIVARLSADMKAAMKAKDADRLSAIRFLNAAIKQHEISLRESGTALTDAEVIKVLQKAVKQRRDSIDSYQAGGRQDLVDKETKELGVVQSYLPAMMSAQEVEAVVVAVVAELGATTQKDMGRVMAAVKAKTEGRADNKLVSDTVKSKLQPAAKK